LDLHRGYGAAGLMGTSITVGMALGAPMLGRLVDRRGLRPMLVLTTVAEAVFWSVAPVLPYYALLVAAFVAGLLALPVFSVVRQSLAALVPPAERRQAYALDSISVELSFMAGPTLAVLLATQASARVAMVAVGVAIVGSGLALYLLNPAVRGVSEGDPDGVVPRRRDWLNVRLVAVLAAAAATTCVLAGTDVAVVAVLREAGRVEWTGLALAVWGAYSMAGGFVYGALPRGPSLVVLLGLLSVFTAPVGVLHGWGWLFLALAPAGALCAPALSATADVVSRMVPAAARGEAMGWHGSALTAGLALGAPVAGAAIDARSPAWGFAAVAGIGAFVTLLLLPVQRFVERSRSGGGTRENPKSQESRAKAGHEVPAAAAETVA
jgi:predicted MFS family arabinose efflux permease